MIEVQPHSEELESAVLGSIILDSKQFHQAQPYISDSKVWYSEKHKRVWNIIKNMVKNREEIDLLTIDNNLTKTDVKNGIDKYWLSGLIDDIVSPSKCVHYAKKLYESFLYRKTINQTIKIQKLAYSGNSSVYPIIGDTYTMLGELLDLRPSMGFDINSAMDITIEEIKFRFWKYGKKWMEKN